MEKDSFLKMLKGNEGNVAAQQEFLRSPNALKYDFTQHYNQEPEKMVNGKGASVHVEAVADVGTA